MHRVLLILLIFLSVSDAEYEDAVARRLLDLSAAAYGDYKEQCIDKTFPSLDFKLLELRTEVPCDARNSTCQFFVVVSASRRQTIVAFRGTNSDEQLGFESSQLYAPGVPFLDIGNIGPNYSTALSSLWPQLRSFLVMRQYHHYSLFLTGHSLGGALASLASARAVKEGLRSPSQIHLYSFGQPRTGSYNYAIAFDALGIESHRVVFSSDLIPHQPHCDVELRPGGISSRVCDASPSNPAYHHGLEVWYTNTMEEGATFRQCTGNPVNEDRTCSYALVFDAAGIPLNAYRHMHYFETNIMGYGRSGCTNRADSTSGHSASNVIAGIAR